MPDDGLTLVLFDDEIARGWEPFALTRPAGELVFGAMSLRARAERVCRARCAGHLAAEHLRGFAERDAPPVLADASEVSSATPRLFLCARAVPAWGAAPAEWREGPVRIGEETVGWFAPPGAPAPRPEFFLRPNGGRDGGSALAGAVLREVWELMTGTPEQIGRDVAALFPAAPAAPLPEGAFRIGTHPLVLGDGVEIEPGVVFDLRAGPIWLDEGATVRAFTRLAGPAYVGPGSIVLGGSLEACSIGAVCRIRGEFAQSICLHYVNKAHDGHMGHGYLGSWVNLGAETTNSDLKNNYGTIRLWTPGGERDTGEIKIGCFLGDHVKTGIGLLLNTGTVIGAGSNLFGAEMPPKYVPPFSWGTGAELTAYREDKFLEVAERAMARRKVELASAVRTQLGASWRRGRAADTQTPEETA